MSYVHSLADKLKSSSSCLRLPALCYFSATVLTKSIHLSRGVFSSMHQNFSVNANARGEIGSLCLE